MLLVEVPKHGNRNLDLSSRNMQGVELVEQQRSASVSSAALRPGDLHAAGD